MTVEERLNIREKIKAAYKRKAANYEDLLETCAAIEEELVFISAPSRLDYFKSGVQFEKRIAEKQQQLRNGPVMSSDHDSPSESDTAPKTLKRAKTQH